MLAENAHLLPAQGAALDLACGQGGNALFLARRSRKVRAWDISPIAIDRLAAAARTQGLPLQAEVRDAENSAWPERAFDVITVSRFLCRKLAVPIMAALKPGGLLYYQTYIRDKNPDIGPRNPDYLLEPNELLRLFAGLRVVVYREEGRLGDLAQGFRNEAMLVACKPTSGA